MASHRKRVTAADVARSLGLSRATVGYVLNETPGQTIPESTKQRVLEAAERLGYRPNRAARMLVTGQSRIVLLVLPDWPIEHSMRVHLDEASLALDEAGYSLVTTTPHPGGKAQPLWESLNPDVVMGLAGLTEEQRRSIAAAGGRTVPDRPPQAAQLGYAMGPRHQVQHLVQRGHRHIAQAGTPDPRLAQLNAQRRQQALETGADHGLSPMPTADVDRGNVTDVITGWLGRGVSAVAAYNDDVAALVAGAALRLGLSVPAELAVIGHDDTPLAELFVPSLSSVRVDSAGLGRYIAARALACLEGGSEPVAGPEFEAVVVPRDST